MTWRELHGRRPWWNTVRVGWDGSYCMHLWFNAFWCRFFSPNWRSDQMRQPGFVSGGDWSCACHTTPPPESFAAPFCLICYQHASRRWQILNPLLHFSVWRGDKMGCMSRAERRSGLRESRLSWSLKKGPTSTFSLPRAPQAIAPLFSPNLSRLLTLWTHRGLDTVQLKVVDTGICLFVCVWGAAKHVDQAYCMVAPGSLDVAGSWAFWGGLRCRLRRVAFHIWLARDRPDDPSVEV